MTSGESSADNFVLINPTAAMTRFKSLPNSFRRTECIKRDPSTAEGSVRFSRQGTRG